MRGVRGDPATGRVGDPGSEKIPDDGGKIGEIHHSGSLAAPAETSVSSRESNISQEKLIPDATMSRDKPKAHRFRS